MNFIKRMVERAVERQLNRQQTRAEFEKDFFTHEEKFTVYRIGKGYIVSGAITGPTYCEDHNAVAEYIVAQTTRAKMGIGFQMSFADVERAARVMDGDRITGGLRKGTLGTLDGQVSIISKPDYL